MNNMKPLSTSKKDEITEPKMTMLTVMKSHCKFSLPKERETISDVVARIYKSTSRLPLDFQVVASTSVNTITARKLTSSNDKKKDLFRRLFSYNRRKRTEKDFAIEHDREDQEDGFLLLWH